MRLEQAEVAVVQALADAAAGADPRRQGPANREPHIITCVDVEAMYTEPPKFVIENLLTTPGVWTLVGSHKSGKTLLAAQLALTYQAGVPFLDWYKTLESRGVLFIDQDDPAGLATLKEILRRSPIAKDPSKFFTVTPANFTIGPNLIVFLEREIQARNLGLVILDSYTAMRPAHGAGLDIVKVERNELSLLDALAKKLGCIILLIHHRSHGNAALDWSDQAAGTFAIGAATEGEFHISRFRDLPSTAPERLLRVRGRRHDGLELVIRFRRETLDYEFVMEGPAAEIYPIIQQLRSTFAGRPFSPKEVCYETGMARATAHRVISRLTAAGMMARSGYGQYVLGAA